jgi:hypothetical protein
MPELFLRGCRWSYQLGSKGAADGQQHKSTSDNLVERRRDLAAGARALWRAQRHDARQHRSGRFACGRARDAQPWVRGIVVRGPFEGFLVRRAVEETQVLPV